MVGEVTPIMAQPKKPNFLVIVADDLGFSDTGPYGGDIRTPNLDRMAATGLRMTDFHTAPSCSPTRAMLLSGTDNHIAGLGQMAEYMMGFQDGVFDDRPGYEGYLNFRVAALPEIMQDAGYHTMMSGKWHLGMLPGLSPSARGFDRCAALLPGAGNHFNYEPQLERANGKPKAPSFMTGEGFWMEGDRYIDRATELPGDFYSTAYFTDRMLEYLGDRDKEESKKPFFGYLAYTSPHWPLQAPRAVIDRYKGRYDAGPEALRLERLKKLQELGLVPSDITPAPVEEMMKQWEAKSAEEKAASARKMEVYSAMVEEMDRHIGRVLDRLEETGELDNTFIIFMSDNGAEGTLLEAAPMAGSTGLMNIIEKHYDNSFENIGNANSFTWYGPWWALAATAPSRSFKGWTTEGGIRCPCIVRYPPLLSGPTAGSISHEFATVMDLLPTCLDLAGVPHPGSEFRGRQVATPRGKSWVPYLAQKAGHVHDTVKDVVGWELFGMRGVRRGDYKAVWIPPPRGKGAWELYNIRSDPGETDNLSLKEKSVMDEMLAHWERYYAETGMFEIDLSKRKGAPPKVTSA